MSNWFWVTGGQTRVDFAELASAATRAQSAADLLQNTILRLWEVSGTLSNSSWVGDYSALISSRHWPEIQRLTAQSSAMLADIRTSVATFQSQVDDYGNWLAQASLLYAAAEGGARGYVQACGVLGALGCDFTLSPSGEFTMRSGLDLLKNMPDALSEFHGDGQQPISTGGSTLQAGLATVTGNNVGVSASAVTVARWWRELGNLFAGRPGGVVVMGEDGNSKWGSQAALALHLPMIVSADLAKAKNPRVSGALDRLRKTSSPRGGADAILRELALGPDGRLNAADARPTMGVTPPLTAAGLLARIAASGGGKGVGEVQILRHAFASPKFQRNPKGKDGAGSPTQAKQSWTVVIKGTQEWAPGSNNPQDMQSNLEAVARRASDQKVAVRLAMDMAGIKPGDPVEFVGHSQGGAIALDLAADLQAKKQYNVVSVLTAGAPTGGLGAGLTAPTLNLENVADLVPALDGAAASQSANTTNVIFDARSLPNRGTGNAHSLETYAAAAAKLDVEAGTNPMAAQVASWTASRRKEMGLDRAVYSQASYYKTTRVR